MTIKDIRTASGLNQREFAEHYHIPLQTLKQWESSHDSSSHRTPPDYVLYLLDTVVLAEFTGNRNLPDENSSSKHDQVARMKKYAYLLRAAQDSRGNAKLWYRYLRKEFEGDICRIAPEDIEVLLACDELSMFQKISLKRAALPESPTNTLITSLNKRATATMTETLTRKLNATK